MRSSVGLPEIFRTLDDLVGGFSFPAQEQKRAANRSPRPFQTLKILNLGRVRKDLGVPFDGVTLSELPLQGMSKFPKHVTNY